MHLTVGWVHDAGLACAESAREARREPHRPRKPLGPGEVRVLLAPAAGHQEHEHVLSDLERHAVSRLVRTEDRAASRASRLLLRHALADALGTPPQDVRVGRRCHACGGPHGAPAVLDAPTLQVSLSHTTTVVAVALHAHAPVGVDVELLGAHFHEPGMPELVLSAVERARGSLDARGMAVTWTRKEAVLKASGHGLAVDPSSLTLTGPYDAPELLSPIGTTGPVPDCWIADVSLLERHAAAVAAVAVLPRTHAPAAEGTAPPLAL